MINLKQDFQALQQSISSHSSTDASLIKEILQFIASKFEKGDIYKILKNIEKAQGLGQFTEEHGLFSDLSIAELKKIQLKNDSSVSLILYIGYLHNLAKSGRQIKFPRKSFTKSWDVLEPLPSDYEFLVECIETMPTRRKIRSIPEFAETVVIPAGKLKGALYSLERTPYLRRPLEVMSPESNIMELYLMWSAQTSKTTCADLCSAYYTIEMPSEQIFCAKEGGAARKWATKRYSAICRKMGVGFRTSIEDTKSRASGNTLFTKEYPGGNIDIVSSLSSSQIASETKRIAYADEISRWNESLGEEGSTLGLLKARLKQWGEQAKFLGTSTPDLIDHLMDKQFKRGTQERFYLHCPLGCGATYPLEWTEDTHSGFKYETEGGHVTDAFYICPKCKNAFWEKEKPDMLKEAVGWVSEGAADDTLVVSMQLNALYSPFEAWLTIAKQEHLAKDDPIEQVSFTNLYKGIPHNEIGYRPEAEIIIKNNVSAEYKEGDVPNDCLFLTFGADVQRGKEKYESLNDNDLQEEINKVRNEDKNPWNQGFPRIELLLLSISWGYRMHGVLYKVFYGSTKDAHAGAFERMRKWIEEDTSGLMFPRLNGSQAACKIGLIDSGDGLRMDAVYRFCERFPKGMILPCKGDQELKKSSSKRGDERTLSTYNKFRANPTAFGKELITISTNYYKTQLYNNLSIGRVKGQEQRPGFISFPSNMPPRFFKMLTAEEKWRDGSFHAKGRRTEALDAAVYAACASDYYLQQLVASRRAAMRKKNHGISKQYLEKNITVSSTISKMRAEIERHDNKN